MRFPRKKGRRSVEQTRERGGEGCARQTKICPSARMTREGASCSSPSRPLVEVVSEDVFDQFMLGGNPPVRAASPGEETQVLNEEGKEIRRADTTERGESCARQTQISPSGRMTREGADSDGNERRGKRRKQRKETRVERQLRESAKVERAEAREVAREEAREEAREKRRIERRKRRRRERRMALAEAAKRRKRSREEWEETSEGNHSSSDFNDMIEYKENHYECHDFDSPRENEDDVDFTGEHESPPDHGYGSD